MGKICDFRQKSPFISETVREAYGYNGLLTGSHAADSSLSV